MDTAVMFLDLDPGIAELTDAKRLFNASDISDQAGLVSSGFFGSFHWIVSL